MGPVSTPSCTPRSSCGHALTHQSATATAIDDRSSRFGDGLSHGACSGAVNLGDSRRTRATEEPDHILSEEVEPNPVTSRCALTTRRLDRPPSSQ
jgi:hypothetical protein